MQKLLSIACAINNQTALGHQVQHLPVLTDKVAKIPLQSFSLSIQYILMDVETIMVNSALRVRHIQTQKGPPQYLRQERLFRSPVV